MSDAENDKPAELEGSSETVPSCKDSCESKLKFTDMKVEPLLFMILFGSILSGSVLTNLLLIRSCEALNYPIENCTHIDSIPGSTLEQEIQPFVAKLTMYKSYIETPLPALMSLFLGSWSDKYGRRPIILTSIIGYFLYFILLIVFSSLNFSPYYVLVSSIPIMLTGGSSLLFSATFSHISDCSKGRKCTFRMAYAEACAYLGVLSGNAATPFAYSLVPKYGFAVVFSVSCFTTFISFLYAVFVLPESVDVQPRNVSLLRSLLDWNHVKDLFQTCFLRHGGHKRTIFFLTISVLEMNLLLAEGLPTVLYLFTRNKFSWTLKEFSIYADAALAMLIVGVALGTVISARWLTEATETYVACLAFVARAIGYIIGGIGPQGWFMYLSSAVGAIGGVAGPICKSVLCRCVRSDDVGKAFVLISFLDSLLPMIVSSIYTPLYNSTIDTFPGAVFIFSASVATVCCLIFGLISYLFNITHLSEYSPIQEDVHQPQPPSSNAVDDSSHHL